MAAEASQHGGHFLRRQTFQPDSSYKPVSDEELLARVAVLLRRRMRAPAQDRLAPIELGLLALIPSELRASMGETRQLNYFFRPKTAEQWLMMFGNG